MTGVAIVGAGAAGLAAARELHKAGADFVVLEARGRAGGRMYTRHTPDGVPAELGAEFIHGSAQATMELLSECGRAAMPIDTGEDRWDATQSILRRVDLGGPDTNVKAFLESQAPAFASARQIAQAAALIEGFDAALLDQASVLAVAKEWRGPANDTQGRPDGGYAPMVEHLMRPLANRVRFGAVIHAVTWESDDGVRLYGERFGEAFEVHAQRAIITVPVGVLQSGSVRFTPELPQSTRTAINAIAMGPVVKVVLRVRSVFWHEQFTDVPQNFAFRALWGAGTQQAPLFVAWAGGGAARNILDCGLDPVRAAIDAVQGAFPRTDVRAQVLGAYHHDWERDPYARGAYSYLLVGGADAREVLAHPLGGKLFFAGEATCLENAGTVAGALDSGYRAARAVL